MAGFALLTAGLFFPLPFRLSTLAYSPTNGDGQFSVWNVAWVARALVRDPLHVLDANIFYPHRGTLAYSEMNLIAGAMAVPVYWMTRSAYAALNFVVLASFVASATCMYYLGRYLAGDRRAAVVGAIGFAYCPYAYAHLLHVQLLMTAGLPLSLLALHRVADRPTVRRGLALGLAMALQAWACAYYAVFVVLMVGVGVLVLAWTRTRWLDRRYWIALAAGAAAAGTATAPIVRPYLALQDAGFIRSADAARQYAANWGAYAASSGRFHSWMLPYLGQWSDVLFPGFLVIGLAAVGIWVARRGTARRRETVLLYVALATAAVWASAGPSGGFYLVLYRLLPMFSLMRAPSRFGLIAVFGLAALGTLASSWLLSRARHPRLLAAVLIAIAAAEAVVPLVFEPVLVISPAYRVLASLPNGPVLELPVYSRLLRHLREQYMLNSTAHWMPLVDAYSDYIPPDLDARAEILGDFPTSAALKDLERDRVRYVVVHLDPFQGQMRTELDQRLAEFAPCLRELYRDPHTVLFEIVAYAKA